MRILQSFEVTNRLRRLNRSVQVVLILLLLGSLNYLSLTHFSRLDITESNRFALSAESKAYLQQLEAPVDIWVTLPGAPTDDQDAALLRYLKLLLREYAIAGQQDGRSLVRVEFVDLFRERDRAAAIAREFGREDIQAVLVRYKDRRRVLRGEDLMRFKNREPVAYTGEAALTSAIVEVLQEQDPAIYFLSGHGETRLEDTHPRDGLSALGRELRSRNITTRALDLTQVERVPEDAGLLVIANPQGPLMAREVEAIRRFLGEQSGRVLVWISPNRQHGLDTLLPQWGMEAPPETVVETDPAFISAGQGVLIRNFIAHPVTESLIDNEISLLVGEARPILPVRPTPLDERLKITPLFATSAQSWSRDTTLNARTLDYDPRLDAKGPIPVAVASQREAASQLGINIPGGKLVVLGSADIFSNRHFGTLGNSGLAFSILNWMLEKNRLIAIPPKEVTVYKLQSSEAELKRTGLAFLAVPLGVALLGCLVFWIRKT